MMPRKAFAPDRPAWTVTGTVWVPRRHGEVHDGVGGQADDGLVDVVGGGDGVAVDRGDDVADLELVVGRPAALEVQDEGLVAGGRHGVADAAERHLLRGVLGVDHEERVESGVGRVGREPSTSCFFTTASLPLRLANA